jgi:ABC-type transporter Mla MlaB component
VAGIAGRGNPVLHRRGALARPLIFAALEEGNVLKIIRTSTTHDRVAYTLSGEITFDQVARIEALVNAALRRGKVVTLDLEHVWRVDQAAAVLIARHARRPEAGVRVGGLSSGLNEWLEAVVHEHP